MKIRKLLSVVTALVLLLSAISVPVFATTETSETLEYSKIPVKYHTDYDVVEVNEGPYSASTPTMVVDEDYGFTLGLHGITPYVQGFDAPVYTVNAGETVEIDVSASVVDSWGTGDVFVYEGYDACIAAYNDNDPIDDLWDFFDLEWGVSAQAYGADKPVTLFETKENDTIKLYLTANDAGEVSVTIRSQDGEVYGTPLLINVVDNSVAKIGDVKYTSLAEAIAAVPTDGTQTTITMLADEELSSGVTVAAGQDIILDLNGFTLSEALVKSGTTALITNRGTLTIQDSTDVDANGSGTGKITYFNGLPDPGAIPYYASNTIINNGTLTIESGLIENRTNGGYAAYTVDNLTNGNLYTPVFTMNGGRLYNNYSDAIRMFLNSDSKLNKVVVNGGILDSEKASGRVIVIHNANAKVNKGELDITGGTINGKVNAWSAANAGGVEDQFTDAQYEEISINISGGKIKALAFDEMGNETLRAEALQVTGGKFTADPSAYVTEGYSVYENTDADAAVYPYTVGAALTYVAQIGSMKYESLEEAIEAAQSGDTIELIADIDYSTTYSVRNARDDGNGHDIDLGDLTLDLNGHTIYSINGTVTYGGNGATITNGTFDLVEKNTDGSYKDGSYALFIDNEVNSYGTTGTVLLKDVVCDGGVNICSADVTLDNVSAHTTSLKFYTVWAETGATVNVNGGTYTDTVTGGKGVFHTDSTATINVNAGTFEVGNKVKYGNNDGSVVVYGGIFTKDPTAYVADGYEAVDNNDGTWTVKSIYAAQIGNVKYATLAEAVAAVPTNGTQTTITLLADVALENGVTVSANKNIVLELNGKTISGNTDSTSTYALITNRGTLTIQDNTDTNKNGTGSGLITTYITNPDGGDIPGYASNTITNTGTLTVKSGMIVNNGDGYACFAIDNQTNGANYTPVLNIEGGRMQQMNAYTYAVRMFCNSTTNFNTVNVSGGIIEGGYGLWLQSPNAKANRAELNISGGVIDARDGFALFIGGTKADRSKNRISITDGTIGGSGVGVQGTLSGTYGTLAISGGQFAGVQAGSGATNFITGGIFGQDPSAYVANGYEAVALTGDDLGKWKVGEVKAGEPTQVETNETFDATYQVTKQVVDDNNDVIGEGTGTLRTVNIRVVTETVDEETTIASVNDADKIIQNLDMEKVLDTVVATVEDDDDDIEVNVQVVRNKPDFDTDNNTITYEVHPEAIVSVNGLASAPVVVSNDALEEDAVFTITLPVPDSLAEGNQYIKVTHISEGYQDDVQIYPLQQDEFGKYFVRFDVTHFSEFELAANDLPLFAGRSITLNGYINLNFYLNLAPDQVTNGEGTVVHFTWAKGTDSYKIKTTDYVSGQGYKASVRLPAAELNYPIRATVEINGVPQEELDDYSVRDYANIILNANSAFSVGYIAENGQAKYDKLVDLVKKMLDYGAKAKVAFGLIDDVPLANSGVDYTMPSTSREELLSLIDAAILAANGENTVSNMEDVANEIGAYRYYSSSLIYLSGCTLRHYFVAQGLDASKFTGVKSGYYYYVDMPDIAAANLDVLQEFHIGETTFRYSALDFVKAIIWNYAEGSSYDLAAATYWYNQAANAYFE